MKAWLIILAILQFILCLAAPAITLDPSVPTPVVNVLGLVAFLICSATAFSIFFHAPWEESEYLKSRLTRYVNAHDRAVSKLQAAEDQLTKANHEIKRLTDLLELADEADRTLRGNLLDLVQPDEQVLVQFRTLYDKGNERSQ